MQVLGQLKAWVTLWSAPALHFTFNINTDSCIDIYKTCNWNEFICMASVSFLQSLKQPGSLPLLVSLSIQIPLDAQDS